MSCHTFYNCIVLHFHILYLYCQIFYTCIVTHFIFVFSCLYPCTVIHFVLLLSYISNLYYHTFHTVIVTHCHKFYTCIVTHFIHFVLSYIFRFNSSSHDCYIVFHIIYNGDRAAVYYNGGYELYPKAGGASCLSGQLPFLLPG